MRRELLVVIGRIKAPGLKAVERARNGGEWDSAYDSSRTAAISPDFQAALDKVRGTGAFFAKLDSANRYAMLWRIQTARGPVLRAKRIVEIIEMLRKKETCHPWTVK